MLLNKVTQIKNVTCGITEDDINVCREHINDLLIESATNAGCFQGKSISIMSRSVKRRHGIIETAEKRVNATINTKTNIERLDQKLLCYETG